MGRAPCCDKANVKRGPWSPEEDHTLRSYIEKHGTGGNWIALPQKAGLKRCGKSCRLRWLNYLRPDIKHGGFTEEEDNIICTIYSKLGSRWSVIASHLPGRTDNDVKNYWNTKLKKKLLARQRNILSSAVTSNSSQTVHDSQLPTEPPHSLLLPSIKIEACGSSDIYTSLDPNSVLAQGSNKLQPDLPQSSKMRLTEQSIFSGGQVVSPSEEASGSSSSITLENGSSTNSCLNWSTTGTSSDEMFLAELGFGDPGYPFGDYGTSQVKLGEVAPYHYPSLPNMWSAATEANSQGALYHSVTYT